jgi:hypothetical protein
VRLAAEAAPPVAGGEPLQALLTEILLVGKAADALPGRLLISLLGEAEHDPDIYRVLQERLFNPRREATVKSVRRAQLAGVMRKDVPPRLAGDILYGPLFYRRFIRHEPVSVEFIDQVFDHLMAGLEPPGRAAKRVRAMTPRARRRKPRR